MIKGAGRMMVQNLAGSLALVTCKEPLRHNMLNQLRGIIQKYFAAAFANEVMNSNELEHAAQIIAQDNLVSLSHIFRDPKTLPAVVGRQRDQRLTSRV